nr:fimbrial protein [Providencia rustigianii]
MEVNFGDMIIKNIDGLNYEQTIPYTLKCDGAESNTKLKLRFENNSGAKFNSKLLKTSEPNLGLKIKRNGQDLSINDWVIFDYENKPLLTVVPITNSSGGLNEGEFDATALLTVEYE